VLGAGDYEGAFALLAEMTQAFANSADVQTTFDRALASIAAHAEAGSLWLVEGPQLACVASVGAHPITGLRLGIDEGIVGKCVREGASQSVLDVSQDPDFSRKMDAQSGFVTRSLLCAPMTFSEQVIGAVELINKRAGSGRTPTCSRCWPPRRASRSRTRGSRGPRSTTSACGASSSSPRRSSAASCPRPARPASR
jgi:putative methionine-R-sulfoxide reductase with GAF domain